MNILNNEESMTGDECNIDKRKSAAKSKYLKKLELIDGVDPYHWEEMCMNLDLLPPLTYIDMMNYLLFTPESPSVYSQDDLRNYKDLDAFHLATSGLVNDVFLCIIKDKHFIKAKVSYSMEEPEVVVTPWLVTEKNGIVVTSHCDCTRECDKTCTHVAALMCWTSHTVEMREEGTFNQELYEEINPPNAKESDLYKRLSEIDFSEPSKRKGKLGTKKSVAQRAVKKSRKIPSQTQSEMDNFLTELAKVVPKAVIFTAMPQYLPKNSREKPSTSSSQQNTEDAVDMDSQQQPKTDVNIEI